MLLVDASGNVRKKHGDWKSNSTAEGYIEDLIYHQLTITKLTLMLKYIYFDMKTNTNLTVNFV